MCSKRIADVFTQPRPRGDKAEFEFDLTYRLQTPDTPPPPPHTPSPQHPPSRSGRPSLGKIGVGGIPLDALHRFRYQVGEGGQGDELAGGEEVAHLVIPYSCMRKPSARSALVGFQIGFPPAGAWSDLSCASVGERYTLPRSPFGNDRHQPCPMRPAFASERMYLNGIGTPDIRQRNSPHVPAWSPPSPPPHPPAFPPSPQTDTHAPQSPARHTPPSPSSSKA